MTSDARIAGALGEESAPEVSGASGAAPQGATDTSGFAYRPALDGIRALAVLAVIAYHDDYRWAQGGFLGVDAFFVLSGFLITTLLLYEYRRRTGIDLVAFWGRRARRLLPALLLVLLFVAVYTRFAVAPWERVNIRNDAVASLFYVANWRFIFSQQSYFELFIGASPLRHMWSLAIEEQFYLIWPLVVLAALRLGRGSRRVLAIGCTAGMIVSVATMAATYSGSDPLRAYYGTDARAHTILIGALLALALSGPVRAVVTGRVVQGIGVVAMVAIVAAWVQVSGTAAGYYRGGSAVYALAVAAVIAAALGGGVVARALAWAPLVAVGRISYGLYLWHWPVNVWLVPTRVHLGGTPLNLVRLAVTVVVALASYVAIELPIRRQRLRHAHRPAVAIAAIVLVGVVIVGASIGAAPLPSYVRAFGSPEPCIAPTATDRREALKGLDSVGVPRSGRSLHRVLVVGDSVGCSLLPGLQVVGHRSGLDVDQAAVIACGVVSDEVAPTSGEATMAGSDVCHDLVAAEQYRALTRLHPDFVVWLSSWERMDMRVDGRIVPSGTRRADEMLLTRMNQAFDRLTAGGARLVLLTVPPFTDGTGFGIHATVDPRRNTRILHLNGLLRRFASQHPDRILVVDLARLVCPHGAPCAPSVDGRKPRPDGTHFSPAASAWAAGWIVDRISEHVVRG